MTGNEEPSYDYAWEKDDFSDVLAAPPDMTEETAERSASDRANRRLFVCLVLNVLATALAVLCVWGGSSLAPKAFLPIILGVLAFLKLCAGAFLFVYWKSLDPKIARTTPCRAALLNLIPGFDLVWFFVAVVGGIVDGIRTIESLDGNRTLVRAPIALAAAFYATYFCTIALFVYRAIVLYKRSGGDFELLGSLFDFETTMTSFVLGLFFSGLLTEAFQRTLGLSLMAAALILRLALMWRTSIIARYVNDVRSLVEPHATTEEREKERERLVARFSASTPSVCQKTTSASEADATHDNEAK